MALVLMDGCQQTTCSFAQKLPLLNILAVVLFGIPLFAILIHFALRSWRSARLDLLERRRGKGSATTVPSAYARVLWALSVGLLLVDWVYFSVANVLRLVTSKPTDLKPPVGSALVFYVGISLWVASLLAVAIMWKMRPRQALPPMLKRAE